MRGSDSYTYNSDRSARRGGGDGDDDAGYGENRRSRGAVFHLKAGDREFRVRCASDESTRECVDAALMMFRQVQDASRTSTTLSPSSPGSSTTSTTPGATGGTGSATGR